tara:strand:+ start:7475 stop:8026 length:552 start_codon:yes stop_codon:yes gene_type:complete
MNFHPLKFLVFVCVSLASVTSSSAGVIGFNFSQDGYEEGASVTGMFVGEDLDMNGQLSSFTGEITDFMMDFSGNSLVPAFSAGSADLFGLVYDLNEGPVLGDGVLGDIEGIGVTVIGNGFTFTAGAGPGPFPGGMISTFASASSTLNNVIVTPKQLVVPEPASLAIWGAIALLGTTTTRRRRR